MDQVIGFKRGGESHIVFGRPSKFRHLPVDQPQITGTDKGFSSGQFNQCTRGSRMVDMSVGMDDVAKIFRVQPATVHRINYQIKAFLIAAVEHDQPVPAVNNVSGGRTGSYKPCVSEYAEWFHCTFPWLFHHDLIPLFFCPYQQTICVFFCFGNSHFPSRHIRC